MGKIIVIEGIDASGKGTQTALLYHYLESLGLRPLQLSFPDYESDSSAPARMYLSGRICSDPSGVNAYAASSFYSVDRYISYKTRWEAEYAAGRVILCNRYTTSNMTHQMEKLSDVEWRPFIDWLCDFEYGRLGLPRPDLVFYLDMHDLVAQKLLDQRYSGNNDKKDIHERNPEYLAHCRRAGLFAAEKLGWRTVRCYDERTMTPRTVDDIQREIQAGVDHLL